MPKDKKYHVIRIEESRTLLVAIEAEDENKALDIAERLYDNGRIKLDQDFFTEINPEEYQEPLYTKEKAQDVADIVFSKRNYQKELATCQ